MQIDPNLIYQIRELIRFYINHQPFNWTTVATVAVAVCAIAVSIFAAREQRKTTLRSHARSEWNGLMDACLKEPNFINAGFTSKYARAISEDPDLFHKYQAFCYRAWSLVDFLVGRKMHRESLYSAIISWVAAFHREWLEKNPYMFSSRAFWDVYKHMRERPLMVLKNEGLPQRQNARGKRMDNVDWNEVSKDYHSRILGPWSPEMMGAQSEPGVGNYLLDRLRVYIKKQSKPLKLLDYGCGPGNMLAHLDKPEDKILEVYGLDTSNVALKLAADKAAIKGIKFHRVLRDMRTFKSKKKFDIIVSTNSILPRQRADIKKIFKKMSDCLKPTGRMFLILPSFDTVTELIEVYWREHFRSTLNNDEFVEKCVAAFKEAKKYDDENFAFADDGVNVQCFHTKKTIRDDLTDAGLEIAESIEKILYPWEYAAKFDYGFFPKKPHIFDWYVEVTKIGKSRKLKK